MKMQVRLSFFFTLLYSNIYRNVQGSCSHKITNSSGTLNVVENVSGPKYCTYTIQKSDKSMTHMRWVYLTARGSTMPSCTEQFVRISRCTTPKTYLVRYCGKHIPHDFFFDGGCVQIDTYNNPGFELTFDNLTNTRPQINERALTVIKKNSNSLNIYSPNWPNAFAPLLTYDSYGRYRSEYRIDLSNNQDIKFIFMKFHLYKRSSGNCWDGMDDVLTFKFLRTDRITEKYSFCGYKEPFTKFYRNYRGKYRYVDVIFQARTRAIVKGFAIGVMLFQDYSQIKVADKQEDKKDGPHPVLAVIPIILVVIFCYCFRKNARQNGGFRAMFDKMRTTAPPQTATFVPQQQQQQIEPPYMITGTMSNMPLYPPPAYTSHGNAIVPAIDSFQQYPLPPPPVYSEVAMNKKGEQSTEL